MTPNGPVGGHMPADVLNVNDPAWRAVPSAAGGGARIAGGVLVAGSAAGAAGAALSYGGGFAGIGGLASGASGSALRAVAPAGGVLRPSALPGGGVAGAVGGAGRGGGAGVVGRGGVAPVGSGGVGDRREKKGQVRRRAYDVVRVDALEERGAQMMGGAAGSADQLKPIARDADADW